MRALLSLVACVLCATPAWSQSAPGPRERYQSLNALRSDPDHTYYVRELVLRRDAVRLFLTEGKLAFLQASEGKITGAVFTGQGRVIAVPPDPTERRSLARFVDTPLLDITFNRAYMRFTDNAAQELLEQINSTEKKPAADPTFAQEWDSTIAALNPWHSLRVLTDWLSNNPLPYFYAGVQTQSHGPLDVMVDYRRDEQVGIGQPQFVQGITYYDLWTSFPVRNRETPMPPFNPVSYAVETTIQPDLQLEGSTVAEIKAVRGGERMLTLELSRQLTVESVTDEQGRALPFFQNEEISRREIASRGNDSLLVALADAPPAGAAFKLRFRYKGQVISDAGNGAYFVGARGIWYPNLGGFDRFATYDLSFRWPHNLELVANGRKTAEGTEGEWRTGRWVSESPVVTAGFNLGNYDSHRVQNDRFAVDVYANRRLEAAMVEQLRRNAPVSTRVIVAGGRRPIIVPVLVDPIAPSPTAQLEVLGKEVEEAIRFNESFSVPFPFQRLAVAQIPGSFGQGWPGLLYLSTLSFLSPGAQTRMGASQRTQEQFLDLVPPHEVAHQWWGNLVGWPSYRDQWISEGLANYLALMFADSRKPGGQVIPEWLGVYRDRLQAKERGADDRVCEAGPLALGRRLLSSKSTAAYGSIIYGKGTWVMHMLRMMLREEKSAEPDARFAQLLRTLAEKYRYRGLSTAEFQREVEQLMTRDMDLEGGRSMEWFFDQWVYGTDIPRYSADFKVSRQGQTYVVNGTLKQKDTSEVFIARVPIYAETARGRLTLLGTVVTAGEETKFRFTAGAAPRKLVIDPHQTVLAFTD